MQWKGLKVTGKSATEWKQIIEDAGLAQALYTHIDSFLVKEYGFSDWWSLEGTVGFGKAIGRLVTGQTAASLAAHGL